MLRELFGFAAKIQEYNIALKPAADSEKSLEAKLGQWWDQNRERLRGKVSCLGYRSAKGVGFKGIRHYKRPYFDSRYGVFIQCTPGVIREIRKVFADEVAGTKKAHIKIGPFVCRRPFS